MLVRDVMTSPAVTITPSDDVAEAACVLDRLSLTSLPVVDRDRRLLGIIGEADVVAMLSMPQEYVVPSDRRGDVARVRDVMTRDVVTVAPDDDLGDAVAVMSSRNLQSLPVILHGHVVGMVSWRDVVRAVARRDLDGHHAAWSATRAPANGA